MSGLTRYPSPVQGPQGLAWDGAMLWVTSAENGRLFSIDPVTLKVEREFVPPFEALGVTSTGSDFRLILAPTIEDPDLERDHRYVYSFAPDAGFAECFACPDFSGSFLAYDAGTLFLSQAWDKRLIQLDERGASVAVTQLPRRPVGMTILAGAFYLATVDDEWKDGQLQRLDGSGPSAIETLRSFPFAPRGVAFDGERFWVADRNDHALVAFRPTG